MKLSQYPILLLIVGYSSRSLAQQPLLKLPYPKAQLPYYCLQGNNSCTSHYGPFFRYDLDFAAGDTGHPEVVIAAAAGRAFTYGDALQPGQLCVAGGTAAAQACGHGLGNHVQIDHGNGMFTVYGHLSSFAVTNGSYVRQGQVIGLEGRTGYTQGVHIHFGLHAGDASADALGTSVPIERLEVVDLNGNMQPEAISGADFVCSDPPYSPTCTPGYPPHHSYASTNLFQSSVVVGGTSNLAIHSPGICDSSISHRSDGVHAMVLSTPDACGSTLRMGVQWENCVTGWSDWENLWSTECYAVLNNPGYSSYVAFPKIFSWDAQNDCRNTAIGFSTTASAYLSDVYIPISDVSSASIAVTASQWTNLKSQLGNSGAYFWTFGEVICNAFRPRAEWRPFTDIAACSARSERGEIGCTICNHDGRIGAGEECDDGNVIDGDCCSATCTLETGQPCNDSDPCTTGDTCNTLAHCVGTVAADGTPCVGGACQDGLCRSSTVSITSDPSGSPNPVQPGGNVSLTVQATDSAGRIPSYRWEASCPALDSNGTFSNVAVREPTWTAPDNSGVQRDCTICVTAMSEGLADKKCLSQSVQGTSETLLIDLIQNGDFQAGDDDWSVSSSGGFYAGTYRSLLNCDGPTCGACPGYASCSNADGSPASDLDATLTQTITIPPNATSVVFQFDYSITTENRTGRQDQLDVNIKDLTAATSKRILQLWNTDASTSPCAYHTTSQADLTAFKGHKVTLQFLCVTVGKTAFRIDKVSMVAQVQPECASAAECDDGNECTIDSCRNRACGYLKIDGDQCDDRVFCNGTDICRKGTCGAHSGDPCAGGLECDSACNEGARSCHVSAGVRCSDDGNGCTDDECDGSGRCGHLPNSARCEDGVFCNGSDICSNGSCSVPGVNPCSLPGQVCDEANQQCRIITTTPTETETPTGTRTTTSGSGPTATPMPTIRPTPAAATPTAVRGCVVGTGASLSCTEAALNACLPGGARFNGIVSFECGAGPTTIVVSRAKGINADTSIDGGSTITLSGDNAVGLFAVREGVSFAVNNIIIAYGASKSAAGGIENDGTLSISNSVFYVNSGSVGGGVTNHGTMTVTNGTFSGNIATSGGGGGIWNGGTANIDNSTFWNNYSKDNYVGGGIYNSGLMEVSNSSFFGNTAGLGGAIDNFGGLGGSLVVTSSTFFKNSATYGAAVYAQSGPVTFRNNIVANSAPGENCAVYDGSVVDGGHNLEEGSSCAFSVGNGSQSNADPRLDPAGLANNGGLTMTIAIQAGSPAIDAGDGTVCAALPVNGLDQRGYGRPGVGAVSCSIGAFEYNAVPVSGSCIGDCDGSGDVTVNEIITLVNMALGNGGACEKGLAVGITPDVSMIIRAVNMALSGCT